MTPVLRLSELKLPLDHGDADLSKAICRRLRIAPEDLCAHRVVKRSVDARRKEAILLVYSLDLDVLGEERLLRRFREDPHLIRTPDERYRFVVADAPADSRPVVVGSGPCGYFAALLLAQMGLRPLLLERGQQVKQRAADTFGFWKGMRPFQSESNAQFGEGGAGTFSDGKLYSQISEPRPYIRKVLEELVAAGASDEILSLHRPHIGTYKLATVVRGLRARIEALGGEVRFATRVERLDLDAEHRVRGVLLADGSRLASDRVVLAIGHSARDTFAALVEQGVAMEPKAFAVGVRIEHPQSLIDRARWGTAAGHPRLGAAEYKLVHHCRGETTAGRSVYSFCMCPGGLVVGATSEADCVVTNGMSQHTRNERNANSGLVVSIRVEDVKTYGSCPGDPMAGVAFQRHWERQAFKAGGGDFRAPSQWLEDFLHGRSSGPSSAPAESCRRDDRGPIGDRVEGSYRPGTRLGSLEGCLPDYVLLAIREALPHFERSIQGYTMGGALLTGVETRTSSPLRILRDPETLESVNTPGLYPAGEGAGYAGGILSAAIDGVKVAEAAAVAMGMAGCPGNPPSPAP